MHMPLGMRNSGDTFTEMSMSCPQMGTPGPGTTGRSSWCTEVSDLPVNKLAFLTCINASLQMGTLGAGNHYAEIQVVDEIFDAAAARKMGIEQTGQVCVMLHSGSRGLGHQVQLPCFEFLCPST